MRYDVGVSSCWDDKGWMEMPQISPYVRYLDELIESSDKLTKIALLLSKLGVDYLGRPEKVVVFTFSPVIAHILYLVSVTWFVNCPAFPLANSLIVAYPPT